MTITQTRPARRYVFGSTEARSLLGRREPGEVVLLVSGVVTGVVLSMLSGGSVRGFIGLALCIGYPLVVVYLPVRGRTLYRWTPVDVRFRAQRHTGTATYVSDAREAGVRVTTGGPVEVAPPPPVGRLNWLSAPLAGGDLAVVVQQDDGALVSVLEIEGPGVGLFDGPDQEGMVTRWGAVLRDLANGDGFVSRISLVERCVPADPEAHQRYIDEFGWVPAPRGLVDSYDDLHARVGAVSEQHRNFVVLRMKADRSLAKVVKLTGGGDDGLAAVMAREAEALAARLEDAGIKVLAALDEARLATMIDSFYRPHRTLDETSGMTGRYAWPRRTENTRDHLGVTDSDWFHATAWIKSWPLVDVGVNFLAPLLVQTPGVIRTIAVTMDLVPTDVAMSSAMQDLTTDTASTSASAKSGRTADPRDNRQLSQAELRARDVADGAGGVTAVGYVTVSATSPELLEEAKRKMRAAATRSWVTLEWCDKEHDRAFVNTLPFARGLR